MFAFTGGLSRPTAFLQVVPAHLRFSPSSKRSSSLRKPFPVARSIPNRPKATIEDPIQPPRIPLPPEQRQVFSAGERPTLRNVFPPGRLPLAVELDFVLNHPATDGIIALLVMLNCLAFALQTLDVGPVWHQAFRNYENNVSIVFLMEFFGRWYGKGLSPRFLLTRAMLVDFVAIAPIGFAVADQSELFFVRILRLTRILRLQRMIMDTEASRGFMERMTNAQARLASVGLSLFSLLYVSAGLFYQVEKDVNPGIRTFFDAFYFSTITLFTVGFGDVSPLTSWGRLSKLRILLAPPFRILRAAGD
ncbi:Ion transport protein [Gracilaria domingensis]|nr:Ion transport protein [Gracilaria domingensis]